MQHVESYTCPMDSEIEQDKPGNCPKCGMRLVKASSEARITSQQNQGKSLGTSTWKDYIPLATIVSLILVTSLVISLKDLQTGALSITTSLSYFMIGFFIVFAGFKLIDLKGFAEGYSTYDLLAKKVFT